MGEPTHGRHGAQPSDAHSADPAYQEGRLEGRWVDKVPPGYRRTDSDLEADVLNELSLHTETSSLGIAVAVDGGIVRLTGSVDTEEQRRLAEEIAMRVVGVRKVENQLRA